MRGKTSPPLPSALIPPPHTHECINVPMRALCMNIIGMRPAHAFAALVRCSDWHASYRVPLRAEVGSRH